jgi:hypothetical protein
MPGGNQRIRIGKVRYSIKHLGKRRVCLRVVRAAALDIGLGNRRSGGVKTLRRRRAGRVVDER